MNFKSDVAYFKELTSRAQELISREQQPGFEPTDVDLTRTITCNFCRRQITGKKLSCSACKAPVYCSKECATKDYKQPVVFGGQIHKSLCKDNQRHMQRLPEFRAVIQQFPWGRIEKDGTFDDEIARGRFNVLGGTGFGFWSHRGGPVPHLPSSEIKKLPDSSVQRRMCEWANKTFTHVDGAALLGPRHLSDRDGWRLEPEFIPYHHFSNLWEPPRLATKVEVKDWDGWYRWRRLPKESPAALLMAFPMSVYWILAEVLKVADPKKSADEADTIPLVVHYIGAEVELNFLPLFSELALLLPHYDIKLIMFGHGVQNLLSATKKKPQSLAANALKTPALPVYTYTAPPESGSGKLAVYLDPVSDVWTPASLAAYGGPHPFPHALVAPNAGLSTYPAWRPVIVWALARGVPFAVTEYSEQSCETQRTTFYPLLAQQAHYGAVCRGPGAPTQDTCLQALQRARGEVDFAIAFNPFQKPGQRSVPTRLPNVSNGFTMVVVPLRQEVGNEPERDVDDSELLFDDLKLPVDDSMLSVDAALSSKFEQVGFKSLNDLD